MFRHNPTSFSQMSFQDKGMISQKILDSVMLFASDDSHVYIVSNPEC